MRIREPQTNKQTDSQTAEQKAVASSWIASILCVCSSGAFESTVRLLVQRDVFAGKLDERSNVKPIPRRVKSPDLMLGFLTLASSFEFVFRRSGPDRRLFVVVVGGGASCSSSSSVGLSLSRPLVMAHSMAGQQLSGGSHRRANERRRMMTPTD